MKLVAFKLFHERKATSMNKRLLKTIFCIGICMTLNSLASIVHVLPVWYESCEKQWYMLLGRNIGTSLWTAFDNEGPQEPIPLGIETLQKYTKGRYNLRNAPVDTALAAVVYGQHFFAVPVTERLSPKILRKARNSKKTDFTWVSVKELIGEGDVIDRRQRKSGCITVEPNFRATLRVIWTEFSKKLENNGCVK
jgi:hypothetical protein